MHFHKKIMNSIIEKHPDPEVRARAMIEYQKGNRLEAIEMCEIKKVDPVPPRDYRKFFDTLLKAGVSSPEVPPEEEKVE